MSEKLRLCISRNQYFTTPLSVVCWLFSSHKMAMFINIYVVKVYIHIWFCDRLLISRSNFVSILLRLGQFGRKVNLIYLYCLITDWILRHHFKTCSVLFAAPHGLPARHISTVLSENREGAVRVLWNYGCYVWGYTVKLLINRNFQWYMLFTNGI